MKLFPTVEAIPEWVKTSNRPWFVTGSTVFECATINSDLDIVVYRHDIDYWMELFNANATVHSKDENAYNESVKGDIITVGGGQFTLNIIPLSPADYLAWSLTTKMISEAKLFKPDSYYLPKQTRLAIFETLNAMSRLTFSRFGKELYLPPYTYIQKAKELIPNYTKPKEPIKEDTESSSLTNRIVASLLG